MNRPLLILGATSAIARALALELAGAGHDLILAGRNLDEVQRSATDVALRKGTTVLARRWEATDFASHPFFFTECVEAAGGKLEGVVLCHGYMAEQKLAQQDFAQARAMIDTNYTAAVSLLDLAANHLEQQGSGFLCAITSVAGDRGRQSNYIYGSTKAALSCYLDGLRHRLAKSRIPVLNVKPGFVDTRMTWGLPGLFLVASPQRVARDIHTAIRKRRAEIYTPWIWRGIMTIIRNVPRFVFHRTKL